MTLQEKILGDAKELEVVERLKRETVEVLNDAYKVHVELGERGKETTGELNEFGDATLKADIAAGKAVLGSFRKNKTAIRFVSEEEKKEIDLVSPPVFLGVLDDLDGSKPYKNGSGRYATMLAFYSNLNPNYCDYLASGVLDYLNAQIFLSTKDQGAYIFPVNGDKSQIHCSTSDNLDPKITRVRVDGWFPENVAIAQKLSVFENMFIGSQENSGASCQYYMDLVKGEVDVVVECTRKRNLEIAVAYGLVKEAGGVMFTLIDGNFVELGSQKYLEFGQKSRERLPVISAANQNLALEFAKLISER